MRTKAWENIQKKNKGVRESSILGMDHGKDLTHLILQASCGICYMRDSKIQEKSPLFSVILSLTS